MSEPDDSQDRGHRPPLAPDERLPLLPGRPALDTRGLWRVRLCVLVFRPIVLFWAMWRQRIMERRVLAKLDAVDACRTREELERVLGRPVYAVDAAKCGTPHVADRIECYESEGCSIDLWFQAGRLVDTSGFVKPTRWDIALIRGREMT